ncbi:MAG: hypothetical protein AB7I32_04880 [Gammaproteobacteria bacterium]
MIAKAGALLGLLLVAGAATRVFAAPTAAELRDTCMRALAAGYVGELAAMCDWYVAPCGVCGKDGPPPRAWCVPAGTPAATLAAQVVDDLERVDPGRPAPAAVGEILRRRHPCAAEE